MASLLKENRFISFCRRLPSFTRFTLTILTLVFTFTFYYVIFYRPIFRQIKEQTLRSKELIQQKISFQNSLKNCQIIEKEHLLLSGDLKNIFSKNGFIKDNVNLFLDCLTKNSWRCYKFEPVETKNKDFYKKEYYQLKAKSNFENIIHFLEDLENANQIIKFKNIKFERKKKGSILVLGKLRFIEFLNNKIFE